VFPSPSDFMNRGKNKQQNQKAENSMTYLDSVINIKYVLLISRRDGRGLPEGLISDTTFKRGKNAVAIAGFFTCSGLSLR
jgi:hypothetical protein